MDISVSDLTCNKILSHLSGKTGDTVDNMAKIFAPDIIYNCIHELAASNFIEPDTGKYYYWIHPTGKEIIEKYGTYSNFKSEKMTDFKPLEFKKDIENSLAADMYATIDILPIVRKYTDCKGLDEIVSIRGKMINLLRSLKQIGLIDYNYGVEDMSNRSANRLSFNPIKITSTPKFESEYMSKNTPPNPQTVYNLTTHGHGSPVSAGDMKFEEIKVNEESNQEKTKGFHISKKTLTWTIISVIALVVLSVLGWIVQWLLAAHPAK